MTTDSRPPQDPDVRWPLAARRYHRQIWASFAVLIAALVVNAIASRRPGMANLAWLLPVAFGGTFTYLAFAAWQYISSLDEMARRLPLEAMAITYLIGLSLFMILAGVSSVTAWTISPVVFVLLEPVRGVVLVAVARKYR